VKRSVTVRLSTLACEGLAGEEEPTADLVPARMVRAIHYYLSDSDAGRPGWRYPAFMRDEPLGRGRDVELSVEDELWASLEREAEEQGVSVGQLAEHAALYFAAEVNSGRATVRILDGLDED